jgi:hypothetical protein
MTEVAQAPPAGKKAPKEAAEYVVLRLVKPEASITSTPSPETWERVGSFKAASSEQARRQASRQGDGYDEKGTYVAVPARSWRPLRPKVTTVTRVTFS